MDGGSEDGTAEILQRYASKLTYWESEKDRGQSHALNKGFSRATGEIFTWLNSDDRLAPGALAAVALAYDLTGADMFAGVCELFGASGIIINHLTSCAAGTLSVEDFLDDDLVREGFSFYQPEVMFTRNLWERAGARVDENLQIVMDYELWLRFAATGARIEIIGRPIAQFRVHEAQKTYSLTAYGDATAKHRREVEEVKARYADKPSEPSHFPKRIRRPTSERRERLKILGLNDIGFLYGAGIAQRRALESLALAGHEVHVATMGDESIMALAQNRHAFPEIEAHVTSGQYDLVFAGNIHAATRSADVLARLSNIAPVVAVLHDLFLITGRCAHPDVCGKYHTVCDASCPTPSVYPQLARSRISYEQALKRAWFNSDTAPLLLANSAWTARTARRGMPAQAQSKVVEATLAFPTHLFRPRDKSALRFLLGLPVDHTIVAFAAATVDDPGKGIAELLALFRSIAAAKVSFLCIGRIDRPELFERPDTFTTGLVLDESIMAQWLAAADVYVTASRLETFGQTVVESTLCGVPAVAYRTTGLADAIIDGVSGILVDPADESGLERAVRRLIRDPPFRQSMGVWGRMALENRRSYAASYHALHRALFDAGILQVGRDSVGLRFQPQLSLTWYAGVSDDKIEASAAYRPDIVSGTMQLGSPQAEALATEDLASGEVLQTPASTQVLAFEKPGTLFLITRRVVRLLYPNGTPGWVKRVGTVVLWLDRALRGQ